MLMSVVLLSTQSYQCGSVTILPRILPIASRYGCTKGTVHGWGDLTVWYMGAKSLVGDWSVSKP